MGSVEEINALAERVYANPDVGVRQQAQERLTALTLEDADITPLQAVFAQSSNQYALMFAAQGVVAWLRANKKRLSEEQRMEVVVHMCGACVRRVSLAGAPRHVMLALTAAYAKLTKLCFEKDGLLTDAITSVLQLLHDTSPAYSRHVAQNGGCGSLASASSSRSTPAPPESSLNYEAAAAGVLGYSLINHCHLPHTPITDEEQREKLHRVALVLLSTMVVEFSKYDSARLQTFMNFSIHRRCSNNFRDACLLDIFVASIAELEEAHYGSNTLGEVVDLMRDCLTYDFMAIVVDETEDALSAQFPTTWRPVLQATRTRQVLWGQHAALPMPYCETLLTGLGGLCGIRRPYFDSTDDRVRYLDATLGDLVTTMQLQDGRLKEPSYVTTLAETCFRFLAPFGYRDLHLSSSFAAWIGGIRAITLDVFRIPFGQPGSFTTATSLLNFWSRLAGSKRSYGMSEDSPQDLEGLVPELVGCFAEARLRPSNGVEESGAGTSYSMDDPEDLEAAMESFLTQSDAVASVAVLDHTRTMEVLAEFVSRSLGPNVLNSAGATAWLFYLASGLVRHVLSVVEGNAVESSSVFFVFCVDCANHRRSSGAGDINSPLYSAVVERALLHFISMVQSVLSSSRLHEALSNVVTNVFQSRAALFQFILTHTGHNMVRGVTGSSGSDEETTQIIRESIELIRNACMDIPNSMLTELRLDLPPVVELSLAQSKQTYKLRTNLYTVLWRFTMVGPYSTEVLLSFLMPIELCMQSTLSGGGANDAIYTAGWLRDLRGVVIALRDNADGLSDFVEWVCNHAGSLHECLHRPAGQHSMVTVSMLRFLEELVTQIGGRHTLPCCAAHNSAGLMLFRHLCSLLQYMIEHAITDENIQRVTGAGGGVMVDGAYETMLKPLSLSLNVMRKSIQGGFVPLGAMYFYNDDTYDSMLLGLLRMVGVFPFTYFKEYSKAAYSVLNLLRTTTEELAYRPIAKLSAAELEKLITFVMYICEDVDTQTGTLLNGLSFLAFIAGLIREVKARSTQGMGGMGESALHARTGTPPRSPMQLPSFYASPSGRLSGTPGSVGGRNGGAGGGAGATGSAGPSASRAIRVVREELARTLEPYSDLWERLVSVAMNVIVCQDRALSVSCGVVYPIFETHPPFWYAFVESFVQTYPEHKQTAVREALSALSHAAESQDRFFSEVFTFRQTMRSL